MNILNMEHISKTYGDKVIFDDISVGIHQGDKIGLIGINGTGKTTFLRILAGTEEPDEGQVIMQNGLRISCLSQHPEFPEGATILSYVTAGKREQDWNPETDAHMILNKLGIADHEEEISHLSGGQKKELLWPEFSLIPRMFLFWMSLPTIWTMKWQDGWKII